MFEQIEALFGLKHIKLEKVKNFIISDKIYKADSNISKVFENILLMSMTEIKQNIDF